MGRYDFRPLRVHQAASQLLATGKLNRTPSWYNVVGSIPPAQTLVRTQPLQHQERARRSKTKKPSKLFQPQRIEYEEDALRKEFYKDHPWELARPRVVLENDGRDAERDDWSHISQSNRPVSGESVVQRQMWLMHDKPSITPAQAYDQARKEFYELRLQEDVERRVAKEEAEATGAYFGKSMLEIGMELEDKVFEEWKGWAADEVVKLEQKQAAMYTGLDNESMAMSPDDPETEAAIEEVADSIPAKGQEALGGAPFRL